MSNVMLLKERTIATISLRQQMALKEEQ